MISNKLEIFTTQSGHFHTEEIFGNITQKPLVLFSIFFISPAVVIVMDKKTQISRTVHFLKRGDSFGVSERYRNHSILLIFRAELSSHI
jgi:hypothetical protein